jgi:DDE superfamily endonuclease
MEDAAVDLWATDEVRFQQHGWRCRMWVPPEAKDPVLLHHPMRRSVGYSVPYGCGMESFSFLGKRVNLTRDLLALLRGLRRSSIRTGRRVVVITDNARYHHARRHKEWGVSHVEDFVLDYLPPTTPNRIRLSGSGS